MSLAKGARLGPYEILDVIGAGGMGEVYRARDTKLGRSVAIKILPDAFAFDPERIARFEREGKVLASLNHPHIAGLHGLEQSGPHHALVMELVEGETLAERLSAGPLEIDEAIAIARQIAEALAAAHEQGIIHRDLKPANIKLRPDGTVKVLDFGLAKALEPAGAGQGNATGAATITSPAMTNLGVILGTAAYMSPEQAKGRPADKRGDVWAFGCVLYEMLAGRRAFEGEDVSDTLATVLKGEPGWSALPSNLPPAVRALLEGCLRKDRRERIGDISIALFLLNQPHALAPRAAAGTTPRRRAWRGAALLAGGVLIGAAVATAIFSRPQPSPPLPVSRFAIALPPDQLPTLARPSVNISPDGARIVYVASGRLFVRALAETEAQAIAGVDGALHPVFSPDGQTLAFWSDSTIKRVPASGGAPSTVCAMAPAPSGMFWTGDSLFFALARAGIMKVPARGGKPEMLVPLREPEAQIHGPQLLPDGRTLLFTVLERANVAGGDPWNAARIVSQSLETGERKTLIEGGSDGRYVPTGHIVYVLSGTLMAVPFDARTLTVTAGSVPIIEGVRRMSAAVGGAHFAFAPTGTLIYMPGPAVGGSEELLLFDRKGNAQPLPLPSAPYAYPRVSTDGRWLAFQTSDGKEAHISIYELSGATSPRRLTFGGNNRFPIWSADGRRVAFQSDREGDLAVFWQPADGGTAERLTKPDAGTSHVPESWAPDGRLFLFNVAKGTETSLWTFSIRERAAAPFGDVRSVYLGTNAVFSPDGRWVAYQVGETRSAEATTYVQPFPPTGAKYLIAQGGRPAWSRDGSELFLVPAPAKFLAVPVKTRPTFSFSNPLAVPRLFSMASPDQPRPYDVTADGRFVGVGSGGTRAGSAATPQIHVVLNWFEELKARVPTK
jgi:serine/threonine protein kinase